MKKHQNLEGIITAWVHGVIMPGQPDSQGDQHDPQAVWNGCIPTLYPDRGLSCWLQSVAGCGGRDRSMVAGKWLSSPWGSSGAAWGTRTSTSSLDCVCL